MTKPNTANNASLICFMWFVASLQFLVIEDKEKKRAKYRRFECLICMVWFSGLHEQLVFDATCFSSRLRVPAVWRWEVSALPSPVLHPWFQQRWLLLQDLQSQDEVKRGMCCGSVNVRSKLISVVLVFSDIFFLCVLFKYSGNPLLRPLNRWIPVNKWILLLWTPVQRV